MHDLHSIRGLLFDKDGTLIDFDQTWLKPLNDATHLIAKHAQQPELIDRLKHSVGYLTADHCWAPDSLFAFSTTEEILMRWAALTSEDLIESIRDEIESIMFESLKTPVPIIDNTEPVFAKLSVNYQLGVASMDDEVNVNQAINGLNIDSYIAFYCGADSGFGIKPQTGMLMAFCDKTGLSPRQVAVVGDGVHDLKMAKHAGSTAIAVLSGASDKNTLRPYADFIFDDLKDFSVSLLDKHNAI